MGPQLPPLVGPTREDWLDGTCGYMPIDAEPTPLSQCLAEARWHGLVLDPDGTTLLALLTCCGPHRPLMELSATLVHEWTEACGLDESEVWWHDGESGCRIDWDGAAAELAAARPTPTAVRG